MWSPRQNDWAIERITADEAFWDSIYPKLRHFYFESMLPELVNPCHPSGQPVWDFLDLNNSNLFWTCGFKLFLGSTHVITFYTSNQRLR